VQGLADLEKKVVALDGQFTADRRSLDALLTKHDVVSKIADKATEQVGRLYWLGGGAAAIALTALGALVSKWVKGD
jgi:hypothetical protein